MENDKKKSTMKIEFDGVLAVETAADYTVLGKFA